MILALPSTSSGESLWRNRVKQKIARINTKANFIDNPELVYIDRGRLGILFTVFCLGWFRDLATTLRVQP
jgi:hypothetical protein